jgi:NAD(P)H-nitrite reductase large subunit
MLTSIGDFTPQDGSYAVLEKEEQKTYASLVFRDGRMVGATLVGRPDLTAAVRKAVETSAVFADLLAQGPSCDDAIDRLRSWYG